MTEDEVTKVLGDHHTLHLVNEPNNIDDLIYSWLAFFSQDDARVINKACYIYTKIKKNRFWPTPGDIEEHKKRAEWLVEMEEAEQEKKRQLSEVKRELHSVDLLGEPKNLAEEVNAWFRWFNSNSIEQVRTAVMRHLDTSGVWPTPSQLSDLLPTVEEQKKLNALGGATHTIYKKIKHKQSSTVPPRAPAISIADQAQTFCQLCGLCDIKDQSKCPMDG